MTESDTFLEVWLAGCEFSPGLTVVDTAVACVQVATPCERSPIPTGSAVLKKRIFNPWFGSGKPSSFVK